MAAYCAQAAFAERFGQQELSQLLESGTGRNYTSAAADADALVDAYVGSRYALPLTVVPAFVTAIAADLTRYELYEEAPTKEVIERRKMAVSMLQDIRDGKLLLPGATSTTAAPTIAVSAADRTFTDDRMSAFVGRL